MPRKPIACPSCGALVSGGRLSCPACGTLVAAVSGGAKAPSTTLAPSAAQPASKPAVPARTRPAARRVSAPETAVAPAVAPAFVPALAPALAPAPRGPALIPSSRPLAAFAARPPAPLDPPFRPTARPGSILQQLEARPIPAWPGPAAAADPGATPDAPPAAIPGAYLAPSAAFSAPLLRPRPARPGEPATSVRSGSPAYLTSATGAVAPVAFAPTFAAPADVRGSAASTQRAAVSVQAPAELPGWLAIAGSAIAAVSFLMPWSRDGVIGAVGSSYFDRWGLANAGYLPLVLLALGLLALNGIPNPVAAWVRAGLVPLAIGGILFGLDWAYQTRPYSDGLGVTLLLVASLVLMAGGILGVRAGRHPQATPLV